MSSPVTPKDFKECISNGSENLCRLFAKALLKMPVMFYRFVNWQIRSDGEVNGTFRDEIRHGITGYVALTAPDQVTGVIATTTLNGRVQLVWNNMDRATNYCVYRSATDDVSAAVKLLVVQTNNYTDDTVLADTPYYYWVSAINSKGEGTKSVSQYGFSPTISGGAITWAELKATTLDVQSEYTASGAGTLKVAAWSGGGAGGEGYFGHASYGGDAGKPEVYTIANDPADPEYLTQNGGSGGSGAFGYISAYQLNDGDVVRFIVGHGGITDPTWENSNGGGGGSTIVQIKRAGLLNFSTILRLSGGGGGGHAAVYHSSAQVPPAGTPGSNVANVAGATKPGITGNVGSYGWEKPTSIAGGVAVSDTLSGQSLGAYGAGGAAGKGSTKAKAGSPGRVFYNFTTA